MRGRLYRSSADRVLAGVCGGLAEYLSLDPVLVRVFFVVFALANGTGILLYLLLWVVLPLQGELPATAGEQMEHGAQEMASKAAELGGDLAAAVRLRDPRLMTWIGATLVLVGGVTFLRSLDLIWLAWLDFDVLWPLLLIVGGVALLLRRGRENDDE